MASSDQEIDILESIYQSNKPIRQRDLANIIGLSLGMTNAILKRLVRKGWLQIRKINNRNIQYIVSPQGVDAILRRSYRYFRRTIKNVVYYKETLEGFVEEVSRLGYSGIVLVGSSDLDFVLEHICSKAKMDYERAKSMESVNASNENWFYLYSESLVETDPKQVNSAYLSKMLVYSPAS